MENPDFLNFMLFHVNLGVYKSDIGLIVNKLSQDIYDYNEDSCGNMRCANRIIICKYKYHNIFKKQKLKLSNTRLAFNLPWEIYFAKCIYEIWLYMKLIFQAVKHTKCMILIKMAQNLKIKCKISCNGDIIDNHIIQAVKYRVVAYGLFIMYEDILPYVANLDNNWHKLVMLSKLPILHNLQVSRNILDFCPPNPYILPIFDSSLLPIMLFYHIFCVSVRYNCVSIHKVYNNVIIIFYIIPDCQFFVVFTKYAQLIGASICQRWTQIRLPTTLKYLDRGGPKCIDSVDKLYKYT